MKSFSASVLDLKRDEGYLIAGGGLTRREPCYQQKEIHAQGAVAQNWCSGYELVLARWELDIVVIVKISR